MNSEDQELLDAWNELREAAGEEEDLSGGVESRHAESGVAGARCVPIPNGESRVETPVSGSSAPSAQSLLIASRLHEKYFS